MKFDKAWMRLRHYNKKIKLPWWKGYWVWENDTIMMHLKDGKVFDIRETEDVTFTFTNIASDEWEVLPDSYKIPNL